MHSQTSPSSPSEQTGDPKAPAQLCLPLVDTCLNDLQRDAKTVALMAPAIKREDVHKQTTIIFTTLQTVAVLRVVHQDTIVLIEFSFDYGLVATRAVKGTSIYLCTQHFDAFLLLHFIIIFLLVMH